MCDDDGSWRIGGGRMTARLAFQLSFECGEPNKLATSLKNHSHIVPSAPSMAVHAEWMKVKWACKNE